MTQHPVAAEADSQPEWLRRKERGSAWAIKITVAAALFAGRPASRILLPFICLYFLFSSAQSRRASLGYLTRALDRRPTFLDVFRHYHTFASCILDRVFFLKDRTDPFDVRVFGEDILVDLLNQGSGCILLGAHIGSFEVLRGVGRGRTDLRVNMMMFDDNAQKISKVLNAIDPALSKDIINLGRPDSVIKMQNYLEKGHFVGVLADRSRTADRHVSHSFLGSPAQFSVSAFRMMAILRQPVVLMVGLYRGGRRYDVHIERFFAADCISHRPSGAELEDVTGRYVSRLEHFCRIAPYNWFNFYDVWK